MSSKNLFIYMFDNVWPAVINMLFLVFNIIFNDHSNYPPIKKYDLGI